MQLQRGWFDYCVLVGVGVCVWVASVKGMEEYCEGETFRSTCRHDEVMYVEKAWYGRMRLGRCVKMNMGYLSCGNDVLHLADARCSGRQHCQISVPDTEFETTQPCLELKSYLEISTVCIPVTSAPRDECQSADYIPVTSPHGYLASRTTTQTGCGGANTPWVIEAQPGQKINLTLLDFGASARKQTSVKQQLDTLPDCEPYAVLREEGQPKSITICGSTRRETNVYMTNTNRLQLYLTPNAGAEGGDVNYLIKYEAIGCPLLTLPPRYNILSRSASLTTVECIDSGTTSQLECRGTKWIGNIDNCLPDEELPRASQRVSIGAMSMPYGVAVAVVVAVAIVIGIAVLTLGLVLFKRRRQLRKTRGSSGGPQKSMLARTVSRSGSVRSGTMRAGTLRNGSVSRTPSTRSMPAGAGGKTTGAGAGGTSGAAGSKKPATVSSTCTTGTGSRKAKYTHIWQMPLPTPGEDSPA